MPHTSRRGKPYCRRTSARDVWASPRQSLGGRTRPRRTSKGAFPKISISASADGTTAQQPLAAGEQKAHTYAIVCYHSLTLEQSLTMDFKPDESVSITLEKSACLVLFELLASSYEQWRKDSPSDSTAAPMSVHAKEHGQRVALWQLEGAIERTAGDFCARLRGACATVVTTPFHNRVSYDNDCSRSLSHSAEVRAQFEVVFLTMLYRRFVHLPLHRCDDRI